MKLSEVDQGEFLQIYGDIEFATKDDARKWAEDLYIDFGVERTNLIARHAHSDADIALIQSLHYRRNRLNSLIRRIVRL